MCWQPATWGGISLQATCCAMERCIPAMETGLEGSPPAAQRPSWMPCWGLRWVSCLPCLLCLLCPAAGPHHPPRAPLRLTHAPAPLLQLGVDGGAGDPALRQFWRGRMGLSKEQQLELFEQVGGRVGQGG